MRLSLKPYFQYKTLFVYIAREMLYFGISFLFSF
jgi:hypothetical protein